MFRQNLTDYIFCTVKTKIFNTKYLVYMCLLQCLLEKWANSQCYDWLTKKCRRHRKETRARIQYKLDKFRTSRSRKKWLKREQEHRQEMDEQNCSDSLVESKRRDSDLSLSPLQRLQSVKENKTHINSEDVSVLSPECLTQRLNENALAQEAVGESDGELVQYLKDERVALFLQNDEFICELRSNQDFMSALQKDYEDNLEEVDLGNQDGSSATPAMQPFKRKSELSAGLVASLDDANLKARIVTMGKVSRKKFVQIAKVFSRSRKSMSSKSLYSNQMVEGSGKDFLISPDIMIEDCSGETTDSESDGRNIKSSLDFEKIV